MTVSIRQPFTDTNRAIHEFAIDTVDSIIQRLESQCGQEPRSAKVVDDVSMSLRNLLDALPARYGLDVDAIVHEFETKQFCEIVEACRADFDRYAIQDPALSNVEEVFYASNGFWATVAYRVAHSLKQLGVPIVPRAISGFAHSRTGVDIHPGASIAPGLFIDHGTGIAIGCTAVLHENVSLYNGVVLGTKSKPSKTTDDNSGELKKRHPTIGANVSLYTNAFVGGDVLIGEGSVVGAYAFICHDVPAGSVITGKKSQDAQETVPSTERTQASLVNQPAAKVHVRPANPPRSSVLQLIGNTPMVEITSLHDNANVRIFAKLEGSNPSGSVKDRIALSLIEQGEKSGALTHDKIILESTSGNTGIALAMVGAAKGYEVVLTMSAAMSEERKKVLRAFGATLVETDPTKGTGGAIEVANQMLAENPNKYWAARQHSSLDNPLAHHQTTAEEILTQVPDITHFIAGIGTFGTLRGAGGRLREAAGAKVIGIEPVLGQAIQGLRNMNEHNPPALYDESLLDQKIMAMADDAYDHTRLLAEREGLLVGMSSGAAISAAVKVAHSIDRGVIVALLPDRGEKYLSTSLFDQPSSSAKANAIETKEDKNVDQSLDELADALFYSI